MSSGEHEHHEDIAPNLTARSLRFAMAVLAFTLVIELAGGLLTGSLALVADSGHVLMDLFAMAISLLAATLATLPPTSERTFGWHRAEILAALLNGVLLVGLSVTLFVEAASRFRHPKEVLALPMLAVAAVGLVLNLVIAARLRGGHGDDINLRSAYLHVLGDTGSSVGVILGGLVIYFTGWMLIDSLISVAIGLVILIGGAHLTLRAGHILLEGVPSRLSLNAVADAVRNVPGVKDVHDLHIWNLCSHIISLSCHVHIDWKAPEDHDRIVRSVSEMLRKRFCIVHSTIQVDYTQCGDGLVFQDMAHPGQEEHDHGAA